MGSDPPHWYKLLQLPDLTRQGPLVMNLGPICARGKVRDFFPHAGHTDLNRCFFYK